MPVECKTVRVSDREYYTVAFSGSEPISVTRSEVIVQHYRQAGDRGHVRRGQRDRRAGKEPVLMQGPPVRSSAKPDDRAAVA
jgi:hypothetical protein